MLNDYEDTESNVFIKVEGKAWIDGKGVLRQLETNMDFNDADYRETIIYDYDGSNLYPIKSVIEGRLDLTSGSMVAATNFRAIETMSDYWIATDFCR